MELGSSKPMPDALQAITGQRNIDVQPLLNYFEPILTWIKKENKKRGEFVGWEKPKSGVCKPAG